MLKRKPTLISIVGETRIDFMLRMADGPCQPVFDCDLTTFLHGEGLQGELPEALHSTELELLVVPDYWMGNTLQAFQARKRSVITAFIERKLKQTYPGLDQIGDFYNYASVSTPDQGRQLYTYYLQEEMAYQVHGRLTQLDLEPVRITTPALMWQARMDEITTGRSQSGTGLIHLAENDCFLYFYFMGQFLFSRQIQLHPSETNEDERYSLLNYEINQSFYLYSQKTKGKVDGLYLIGSDVSAASSLSELLGRDVLHATELAHHQTDIPDASTLFPACQGFGGADLNVSSNHSITYKPLFQELAWRTVQWTGIAVGVVLALLVAAASGYLGHLSTMAGRQMNAMQASLEYSPEEQLHTISSSLDEITSELSRPSGSGTVMRALLAMPENMTIRKVALQLEDAPYLRMEAMVRANDPDAFKGTLKLFLDRFNVGFKRDGRLLREKDVTVRLERHKGDEKRPTYLIQLEVDL